LIRQFEQWAPTRGTLSASHRGMASKEEKGRSAGENQATPAGTKPPAPLTPEPQKPETSFRAEATAPLGLDQIREILFGTIVRELERRMARADVHMSTRSKEIEQEARRRTEVVEGHVRTEIAALASRVERALVETADALRSVVRENRDAIGAIEKRLAKVEESGAGAQRELRNQMLDQAKSFLDELRHLRAELLEALEQGFEPEGEPLEELGGAEERPRH